jgi:hypothetical protein
LVIIEKLKEVRLEDPRAKFIEVFQLLTLVQMGEEIQVLLKPGERLVSLGHDNRVDHLPLKLLRQLMFVD